MSVIENNVVTGEVVTRDYTESELAAIEQMRAVIQPNAAIDAQIAALEGSPLFLSRPVREFTLAQILYNHLSAVHSVQNPMLASDDIKAQGIIELITPGGQHFNKGFANMKALDDRIKDLRSQRV